MPYCPQCGSRNGENKNICENCGSSLDIGKDSEVKEKPMDEKNLSENILAQEFQTEQEPDHNFSRYHLSDTEPHLGKGLIKPTNIQVSSDGYHFSYEKPSPQFAKAEPITKSGVIEKRVVNPEFIKQAVEEGALPEKTAEGGLEPAVEQAPNTEMEATSLIEETAEVIESSPDEVKEEVNPEAEALLSEDGERLEDTENVFPEIIESVEIEESESVGSEEPIKPDEDFEAHAEGEPEITYLAGRMTWFGAPLPSTYRITNHQAIIYDPSSRDRQIDLNYVSEVNLRQSFLAKILGIGNIVLKSEQEGVHSLILTGVTKPREIIKRIESLLSNRL